MLEVLTVEGRCIVSLRVARDSAEEAADRMQLAASLSRRNSSPSSLSIGPGHWLLMSDSRVAEDVIRNCHGRLTGLTFNAVNCTDAFEILQLTGDWARELLSSGCGLDFREKSFSMGACHRTRFGHIEATISALGDSRFEIAFDKSYERYMKSWIHEIEATLLMEKQGRRSNSGGLAPN